MAQPALSVEQLAVRSGYWRVSLPVWLLMMAFCWLPFLMLGSDALRTPHGLLIVGTFIALGIIAGWGWWSISAPHWRLWAYERAEDLDLLQRLAVADKLVWPVAHPLTRTEFRFGALKARLREFEARMGSNVR